MIMMRTIILQQVMQALVSLLLFCKSLFITVSCKLPKLVNLAMKLSRGFTTSFRSGSAHEK